MKKILPLLSISFFPLNSCLACAVCFGGADGNLIRGFTWGIALLLILPFALMGGLTTWIMYAVKKNKPRE